MYFKNKLIILVATLLCFFASQSIQAEFQFQLVKDINPGAESSNIRFSGPMYRDGSPLPIIVDNKLFFVAEDGVHGKELWQSDGTTDGTRRVGNIQSENGHSSLNNITQVNDTLFLTAKSDVLYGQASYELKAVNYTSNESISIKKLPAYKYGNSFVFGGHPSSSIMGSPFVSLTNVNGTLFFIINVENGKELWTSDGSATGTTLIKAFSESNGPSNLTSFNNQLFFVSSGDLWVYNGADNSTALIKEGIEVRRLQNKNGLLIFSSKAEENDGVELWKSDGTTEGTVKVKGLGSTADIFSSFIGTDTLFFVVRNKDNNTQSLWRSDGTTSGTTLLITKPEISNFHPQGRQIRDSFNGLIHVNNLLFFATADIEKGEELWKSDGSAAGTVLVKNIDPRFNEGAYLHNLTHVNGSLFFLSNNALWKSDGTEAGTTVIPLSSTPDASNLRGIKDKLFFTFSDQEYGNELRLFNTDPAVEVEPNPPSCELVMSSGSTPIMAGQSTSLAWNTNFASTASIDNGIGEVAISDILDVRDLYPTETTTYTMTVTGVNGDTVTCKATIVIEGVIPPSCDIGTDPQVIKAGQGTALWWWTKNAENARINNGIETVSLPSDYKWIYPTETTTYAMSVNGPSGVPVTCETTVVVEAESLPPICEMGADPQVITAGEGTALWWWSQNVSSATINNEKWSVTVPSDYTWFYPSETATYTMIAIGDDGSTTTCDTTITVK